MEFSNLRDIVQAFNTEEKCQKHLIKMRWPNWVACPKCSGHERISKLKARPLWWCGNCKRQFSIKTGTIFEGSRTSLQKWFMAIWLLTSHKKGISLHQLKQDIGVTQKTAQFMLSRLHAVIPKLAGGGGLFSAVKNDNTHTSGKQKNKHLCKCNKTAHGLGSRKTKNATLYMQQRGGKSRAFEVLNLQGATVRVVVSENVIPNYHIISDKFRTYENSCSKSYVHDSVNHSTGKHV